MKKRGVVINAIRRWWQKLGGSRERKARAIVSVWVRERNIKVKFLLVSRLCSDFLPASPSFLYPQELTHQIPAWPCTRIWKRVPNLTGITWINNHLIMLCYTRVNPRELARSLEWSRITARSHQHPHKIIILLLYQPGYSSRFHAVSQCDVIWPSIKLPLDLSQDSSEHRSCMDSDAHVQSFHAGLPPDLTAEQNKIYHSLYVKRYITKTALQWKDICIVFASIVTHAMWLIMSRPISTAHSACFLLSSRPAMQ